VTVNQPLTMGPAVRLAGPDDAAQLERLGLVASHELRDAKGGADLLRSVGRPPRSLLILEDAGAIQFVGLIGGEVVGTLGMVKIVHQDGTTTGDVQSLFVEPPARSVSVGEALVQHAVAYASQRGWAGIDAFALPGDRVTKNFFEAFGFTTRLLTVHHRLGLADA